ncbi:MAG: DUF177 domain-containing protein [Acidobacteriota bacterium]
MRVNILDIPNEGLEIVQEFKFEDFMLLEKNSYFLGPAQVKIKITKKAEKAIIEGQIFTQISLICSRCLSDYTMEINSSFNLVYYPMEQFLSEELKEKELREKDLESLYYRNNELNIDSIILEQINLSIPLKPICSENCKGLCEICGVNLNIKSCGCELKAKNHFFDKIKLNIK